MTLDMRFTELQTGLSGEVLQPGNAGYDQARSLWNAMIDRRPALIARCTSAADVVRAVGFARDKGLLLAIRGGGHNIAGTGSCDGGLQIDMSGMKAVTVDPAARRATAEAGATLADFDAATQAHGLVTPLGINSTTGLAGLTLGGGFGWLSRKYGMTVDNLEAVEIVTAAGEVIRASATEHPDLFWALCGGGGNFGVVTKFEFRLHPLGPDVLTGLIVYSLDEARSVFRQYDEFLAQAPDELSVWAVVRQAPPLPFLPAEAHGTDIVVLAFCYAGAPEDGEPLVKPLGTFGTIVGQHVGVQPFVAWQQLLDPLLAPGARNYWKSHNFTRLDEGLVDVVVDYVRRLPSPHTEIGFGAIGGATTRRAPDATAYAHRDTRYVMNVHGRWMDPADDEKCIAWTRSYFQATAPFASSGAYINFLTADETERVRTAFGPNYDRLVQVKREYDPNNLFRVNQNIKP